jgi:hypothetical protein
METAAVSKQHEQHVRNIVYSRMRLPCKSLIVLLLTGVICLTNGWAGSSLRAQQKIALTVKKNKFCINGRPKFLLFASYFDASDAVFLRKDLDLLHRKGFNGIRIFPNWWNEPAHSGHTLFDSLGHIRPHRMKKLLAVINAADTRHLAVDITFCHETISGLSIEDYKKGIIQVVKALKNYTNILYDLQNERNGHETFFSEKDIISLREKLKAIQPGILLSASEAYEATPEEDIAFVDHTRLNVVNYHEPRGGAWWDSTSSRVRRLLSAGKPVYLGEPGRWRPGSSLTAEDLITAARAAKKAGAAAWTFHSEAGFDLDHSSYVSRLDPKVEGLFLDSLSSVMQVTPWGLNENELQIK